MTDLEQLLAKIASQFEAAFGRTPLSERVQDIIAQSTTLGRFTDTTHLRAETGDLLCSALALCTECNWDPGELIAATLEKISARHDIYSRLGRKLRVALLGGAFDPIHCGHLEVATEVLRSAVVDEVWLMPCYDHLAGKAMAAPEHRLHMCRLGAKSVRAVGVFDYEIRHRFRGETYHLIKNLLAEDVSQLKCDFSLIIGQDNADGFSSWTNCESLERMIPFIVVPRGGCALPKASAWYLKPPHRYLESATQTNATSSTEIRELLRSQDPTVEQHLPPNVLTYIQANGLYRPEAPSVRVSSPARRIAVFASTFDPPSNYHRAALQRLLDSGFDEVIVSPTGPRPGRGEPEHAASAHRAALTDLNFRDLPRIQVDLTDLDRGRFSQPSQLEERYSKNAEVWHVIDAELVTDGRSGRSGIHTRWEHGAELWEKSRFAILQPSDQAIDPEDLPRTCQLFPIDHHLPSADLRRRVYAGQPIDDWVTPDVTAYIDRHRLFLPSARLGQPRLNLQQPRLLIEYDQNNTRASELANRYRAYASDSANLILVLGGDGTMLHAIRKHWRKRLPFVGLNAGHLGFLANERLPAELEGVELVTYSLPMLRVETETSDGRTLQGLAFSDAWVERDSGQAAWLRLDIDGQTRVAKLVGDGMLVATASGSSAYARALGATPVPINTPVLTLAGSNIFRPRFWKPMTIADDAVVSLVSLDRSGKRPVRAFLDGQPLGIVQQMTIQHSSVATVELAFTREFDPSGKLLRSLFPSADDGQ